MVKFSNLLFLLLALLTSPAFSQKDTFAITNASVIPMNKDVVLQNQVIVISKGRILEIGSSKNVNVPAGCEIIDAAGRFLLPGLFDMHTHFLYEQGDHVNTSDAELKLMLANGVTTARIMAGHPAYLAARDSIRKGKWIGPDIFVASPQLAGQWPFPADFKNYEMVTTSDEVRAAVKKFRKDGYDEIKITFKVTPEVYAAITETAKSEKIKVTGHVGPLVKLPAALAAKQQIEHMDEFIEMLLPDTSYNHGQSVSDYNIYSKKAWATVPHLDENKIKPLARMIKQSGVYVTPTNYFFVSSFGSPMTDEEIKLMPDYQFIPSVLKEEKWRYRSNYLKNMAPEEDRKKYVRIRYKMVYELWKTGVPLMAGSDAPEFFIVTGFALHKELEKMVEAGLTPYAALQTATINPASYLGALHQKGTIEKGKQADMILLDKNPLKNIRNISSIAVVIKNGVYYNTNDLTNLLSEAKTLAR